MASQGKGENAYNYGLEVGGRELSRDDKQFDLAWSGALGRASRWLATESLKQGTSSIETAKVSIENWNAKIHY